MRLSGECYSVFATCLADLVSSNIPVEKHNTNRHCIVALKVIMIIHNQMDDSSCELNVFHTDILLISSMFFYMVFEIKEIVLLLRSPSSSPWQLQMSYRTPSAE